MATPLTMRDKVILDYPIPMEASVWRSLDMTQLFSSCLDDCNSDLELYESVVVHASPYTLPEGTRAVSSCKVVSLMNTQSNQFVKHTFDRPTRQVACRMLPARVTYKRDLSIEDLDNLRGSNLQYFKAYVIVKMLEKEISWLTAIKLESTTGSIDVAGLRDVKASLDSKLDKMHLDILFPSNG